MKLSIKSLSSPSLSLLKGGMGVILSLFSITGVYAVYDDAGMGGIVTSGNQFTSDMWNTAVGNIRDIYSRTQYINTSGGNTGIGTVSPSQKLTITDTASITNTAGIQRFLMGNQDSLGVNRPSIIQAANGAIEIGYGNSWAGNGGTFTNVAHFDPNGNVGIGTVNPQAKLVISDTNNQSLAIIANQKLTGTWPPVADNTTYTIQASGPFPGNIAFATGNAEMMRINVAGNVGIGTASPTQKLEVAGTAKATAFIGGRLTNETNGVRIASPDGASFATQTSSITGAIKIKLPVASFKSNTMMRFTVKIYEYSGGSVGTSRSIDVGGYNYSDAAGSWYNYFATQSTMGGNDINVRFGNDGTSQVIWIGDTTTVWSYPQVFVTDFQGGYSNATDAIWGSGWNISFQTTFNTVTQGPIVARKTVDSSSIAGTSGYISKFSGTNSIGNSIVYDTGTNVGIGTTGPAYKLDVSGDIQANGWLRTLGNAGWYSQTYGGGWYMIDNTWIRGYNGKSLWMGTGHIGTDGGLTLGYGGTTPPNAGAIIAGNVGIGTTSPATKLDITGGHGDTKFRLYSAGNGSTLNSSLDMWASEPGVTYDGAGIGNNVNGHPYYGRRNASLGQSLIRFYQGNTFFANGTGDAANSMVIMNSGNVGIGTTSPATRLHVSGDIAATGWVGAGCESNCDGGGNGYSLMYANGNIVNTAKTTSATLGLANGFEIQQGGSNYGQFNSWVHLNGFYGLYSTNNSAHLYPNNSTYGSWKISGTRSGWGGINYNGSTALMMQDDAIGLYNEAYSKWIIYGYGSNGATYIAPNGGDVNIGTIGAHVTVPTPTASTDAATKAYVDSAVSAAGGGGFKIYKNDGVTLLGYFFDYNVSTNNACNDYWQYNCSESKSWLYFDLNGEIQTATVSHSWNPYYGSSSYYNTPCGGTSTTTYQNCKVKQ